MYLQVAYSFDAGPNACLFMMDEDVPVVMSLVSHFFPPGDIEEEFMTGSPIKVVEEDQVGFSGFSIFTLPDLILCTLCKKNQQRTF